MCVGEHLVHVPGRALSVAYWSGKNELFWSNALCAYLVMIMLSNDNALSLITEAAIFH